MEHIVESDFGNNQIIYIFGGEEPIRLKEIGSAGESHFWGWGVVGVSEISIRFWCFMESA